MAYPHRDSVQGNLYGRKIWRTKHLLLWKIRTLVEEDELQEAVDLLLEFVEIFDQQRINEASILKRRLNNQVKTIKNNNADTNNTTENRLALAILEICDKV